MVVAAMEDLEKRVVELPRDWDFVKWLKEDFRW